MLRNSVKRSKRYQVVLMLLTVLLAVSCDTVKTTTTATQTNSTKHVDVESTTDVNVSNVDILQAQYDSLIQASLRQTMAEMGNVTSNQTLRLLIFDTTQPPDTATGLPRLMAALDSRSATERKDVKAGEVHQSITKEAHGQTTDSAGVQISAQHQKKIVEDENLEDRTSTKVQKVNLCTWLPMVCAAFLVLALCLFYYMRKTL